MSKKQDDFDDVGSKEVEVDDELVEEFSSNIEKTINKVIENNKEIDPRLELLITLSSFCSQVAIDSGFDKKEFIQFMEDMFEDYSEESAADEKTKETSKSKLLN